MLSTSPATVSQASVPEQSDPDAFFWQLRPDLATIEQYARARLASPWAVLGVVLTRVIVATPYVYHLPPIVGSKASLNLFCALVGPSSAGKGISAAVAREVVEVGDLVSLEPASGEAIAHAFKQLEDGGPAWRTDDHAVLVDIPEIDSLAGRAGRQGSILMPTLRKAWSGETLGQVAVDKSRSLPVEAHQYRMGLTVGVQPLRSRPLLDDAAGGTPQRFLWMPALDRHAPEVVPAEPDPIKLQVPPFPDHGAAGCAFKVCAAARDLIVETRRANLRGDVAALDGHALLTRLKVAAALALLDGRADVADTDWILSEHVMRKSDRTRDQCSAALARAADEEVNQRAHRQATAAVIVEETIADARTRRAGKGILRRLESAGGPIVHGDLRRSLKSDVRSNFDDAVEALIGAGQIVREKAEETTTYRLAQQVQR